MGLDTRDYWMVCVHFSKDSFQAMDKSYLVTEGRKLPAVLNPSKRMALCCWSRREKADQELNAAIPTNRIEAQLRSRRLKLWMSACRNSGLTQRLCQSDLQTAVGGRPVQQRNWMYQLRTDAAEIFGTVADAEECIKTPSLTWPKTNLKCQTKAAQTTWTPLNLPKPGM